MPRSHERSSLCYLRVHRAAKTGGVKTLTAYYSTYDTLPGFNSRRRLPIREVDSLCHKSLPEQSVMVYDAG